MIVDTGQNGTDHELMARASLRLRREPPSARQASSNSFILLTLLGLMIIGARITNAQGNGIAAAPKSRPRVTVVTGELKLGQIITVQVSQLSDWAGDHDPRKLVLYLNGRPLKGLYPEQINLSENKLLFHLQRTQDSKQVWADLFHEPVLRRPVTVSAGLADQMPFDTAFDDDNRLGLIIIPKFFGVLSLAAILIAVVLFVYLAKTTDIIRCSGPQPGAGQRKPYSLERAQTAFWFLLVSLAFLCLWLVTGDTNTLTPSVLGLIGISSATTLVANAMKRPKTDQGVDGDAASNSPLELPLMKTASAGFWSDIMSDDNGYSFHCFQIVAWTMLLGIIFVYSVYHYVAMPDFSAGVLALMGISAGTYLGFESVQQNVFGRISEAGQGASTART
jgi:hypothetical protein